MKKYQIMYYVGAAISLLVGLWHFTIPWMFGWASYIPYETLVIPINYVNLCFSFLLSGLSLTVILWGKKVFAGNPESNVWMSYGQFGGSVLVCVLLLVPFIRVVSTRKNRKSNG